jgi:hypothetical protein
VPQLRTAAAGLARGGGVGGYVKRRRQTFDIFSIQTRKYKPGSSAFSLGMTAARTASSSRVRFMIPFSII